MLLEEGTNLFNEILPLLGGRVVNDYNPVTIPSNGATGKSVKDDPQVKAMLSDVETPYDLIEYSNSLYILYPTVVFVDCPDGNTKTKGSIKFVPDKYVLRRIDIKYAKAKQQSGTITVVDYSAEVYMILRTGTVHVTFSQHGGPSISLLSLSTQMIQTITKHAYSARYIDDVRAKRQQCQKIVNYARRGFLSHTPCKWPIIAECSLDIVGPIRPLPDNMVEYKEYINDLITIATHAQEKADDNVREAKNKWIAAKQNSAQIKQERESAYSTALRHYHEISHMIEMLKIYQTKPWTPKGYIPLLNNNLYLVPCDVYSNFLDEQRKDWKTLLQALYINLEE